MPDWDWLWITYKNSRTRTGEDTGEAWALEDLFILKHLAPLAAHVNFNVTPRMQPKPKIVEALAFRSNFEVARFGNVIATLMPVNFAFIFGKSWMNQNTEGIARLDGVKWLSLVDYSKLKDTNFISGSVYSQILRQFWNQIPNAIVWAMICNIKSLEDEKALDRMNLIIQDLVEIVAARET